jgi:hypothetical protein
MAFGRLICFITPPAFLNTRTLWVSPRWITVIFVLFDISSFCIQFLGLLVLAGAYKPSSVAEDSTVAITRGEHILKFGLVIQLLCFGLFGVIGARFLYISREWVAPNGTEWRLLAWVINISAFLIMVRNPSLTPCYITKIDRAEQSIGL